MSLHQDLAALLVGPPQMRISAAESLTSGWLQAELASISGSSRYYVGGLTAYTLESKITLLKVDESEVAVCAGVSATVARQMAQGACQLFKSDLGLATTGYAESDEPSRPPRAYWCIAHLRDSKWQFVEGYTECPGLTRTEVQERITQIVLVNLRDYLRRPHAAQGA